jgi:hypothetical protein
MKTHASLPAAALAVALVLGVSGEAGPVLSDLAKRVPQVAPGRAVSPAPRPAVGVKADFGRVPLYFIANTGQLDTAVDYYIQGGDKTIYFSPGGVTVTMGRLAQAPALPPAGGGPKSGEAAAEPTGRTPERWVVKLDFLGSNPDCRPVGRDKLDGVISYFKGKPRDWKTGLPTYSRIVYPGLWPGIDLVYYGTVQKLKYEFIVHPGANPSRIRLGYRGATGARVDGEGRLEVTTPLGGFRDDAPSAYQETDGRRTTVPMAYRLASASEAGRSNPANRSDGAAAGGRFVYGFEVGAYDRSQTLVLDPAVLVYCGYVGGNGTESGAGIAVDGSGNAYVTGSTISTETTFPVAVGPDLTHNAGYDVFVAKVNAAGTGLVYCGFIGGDGADYGNGIAVDAAGCAYVTGTTDSDDTTFPVTVGPDLDYGATGTGGYPDAFVAKVGAAGTGLVYCGYIGGRDEDRGYAIAVDGLGCAYVTGFTTNYESLGFPLLVGPDLTFNGLVDAFVTKVKADGTGYAYSGYIGGAQSDYGRAIAVDASGNAYVAGICYTGDGTFPAIVGPDLTFNGNCDAFVAKINAAGTGLDFCGFIGGDNMDIPYGIAVDGAGCAYVAGQTFSTELTFPVTVGPDMSANGLDDAFVAKVSAAGDHLEYAGFIGGSLSDFANGIAVDGKGNAYVTGETASSESSFPVVSGPDLTYNANRDAFVAKIKPGGYGLEYCGYIGGTNYDWGAAIAVDSSGNAYVTGRAYYSSSPAFPVTGGPDLTFNGGPDDAFVAKVYYFDENISHHAVGDFDGDGTDEAAVDFGLLGVWVWDGGAWGLILPADPENLLAADVDGGSDDEIIADLGKNGLWYWLVDNWYGLSSSNPESIAAVDVDGDGRCEIAVDFGSTGLWLWNSGSWTKLSSLNADYVTGLNADGSGAEELAVDFGPAGLWLLSGSVWSQISGANPIHIRRGNIDGVAGEDLVADFGALGAWLWGGGAWTQLSGARPDYLIGADADGDGADEIAGDFGPLGLWLWDAGAWTQLSGVNADYLIAADVAGGAAADIIVDFGAIGLWLRSDGAWTQLSGANPEYVFAGDFDGDARSEIMADFGTLGLWLWNSGVWSQLSGVNPD